MSNSRNLLSGRAGNAGTAMSRVLPAPSHDYWIGSKTVYEDSFVGVQDPDWFEQAYEHGMACDCKALHPDYPPLPVDMDLAIEPLGFCSPARLALVIRKDFYECTRPYAIDQVIGKAFLSWEDDDGVIGRDPYPEFVTCYTPPDLTVSVREGKRSWYIYCQACCTWRRAIATSPKYFLRSCTQESHVVQNNLVTCISPTRYLILLTGRRSPIWTTRKSACGISPSMTCCFLAIPAGIQPITQTRHRVGR